MRPRILIALLALGALVAAGWYFFVRSPAGNADEASSTGDATAGGSAGARRGQPNLPGGSGEPGGSGATGRGLDCARPTGNAAIVDDQPITVERLCSSLSRIGAVKPTGVDLGQAKLVLDRMIDGVIVHRALEQANLKVTDAEVDASLK
nr:hypothetical protein [Deltaproteobacteria bacterium]